MVKEIRGQIAIFVIIAIVLVASLIIALLLRGKTITGPIEDADTSSFLDSCIEQEVSALVEHMIPQGGLLDPNDTIRFENVRAPYLCKNINYYEACVAQHPLLLKEIQHTLELQLKPKIEVCLARYKEALSKENTLVDYEPISSIQVELRKDVVLVTTEVAVQITRDAIASQYESFATRARSPLYNLAHVAQEIASQEARFCYFSNDGYVLLNRDFDIKRHVLSDATKVYSISHRQTNTTMYLAIRGCAIPAGY